MRRLRILYYWLFRSSNNVQFLELISFLFKPKVKKIALRYLTEIKPKGNWLITKFKNLDKPLFWPKEFSSDGIYQVTSETFDKNDWHYYQKDHTVVSDGEVVLDVGAAEGLFALSVVDKCEKMILIEPNSYFVASLRETFKEYSNKVMINEVAVGDFEGTTSFNENALHGGVGKSKERLSEKKIVKIDSLITSGVKITYLKADIEGFELNMLKGAEITIKKNKPKMAITSYHTENDAKEIIDLVKSYVPEYQYFVKGIHHTHGKPVMIHFWIDSAENG